MFRSFTPSEMPTHSDFWIFFASIQISWAPFSAPQPCRSIPPPGAASASPFLSLRGATPILFSWAPDLPLGSGRLPPLPWPPQPTVNSSSCNFYSLHCSGDPQLCEIFKKVFSWALSKTSTIYWWNEPQEGRNQEGTSQTQEEIVSTEKT